MADFIDTDHGWRLLFPKGTDVLVQERQKHRFENGQTLLPGVKIVETPGPANLGNAGPTLVAMAARRPSDGQPKSSWDKVGRSIADGTFDTESVAAQQAGALGAFLSNYLGVSITHRNDKYHHCKANCEASSLGSAGDLMARILSDIRDPDYTHPDNIQDQVANHKGRATGRAQKDCESYCSSFKDEKRRQ